MPHLHFEKKLLFMCIFGGPLLFLGDDFAVMGSIFLSLLFHFQMLIISHSSWPLHAIAQNRVLKGCPHEQWWGGALRVTNDLGSGPGSKRGKVSLMVSLQVLGKAGPSRLWTQGRKTVPTQSWLCLGRQALQVPRNPFDSLPLPHDV